MRHLFAWNEANLIGRFDQDGSGRVRFEYAPGQEMPLSLSLPLSGIWEERAPGNFLQGMLPDGDTERLRMQKSIGAKSTDAFDLLESVDSSGAVVFTSSGMPPQPASVHGFSPITLDDVEAQMERVWVTGDAWWRPDVHNRFSLAGSQGKFSVVIHDGRWFWPSASLPSTHIVKPDGKRVEDVAEVEHATLELARLCGLDVPENEVICLGERAGLLIRRFDRITEDGVTHRIHCEDLAQAMGIAPDDKYEPEIVDVVRTLGEGGQSVESSYAFMRQVIFNALVGNSDAHAKNYSIVFGNDGIELSPLYDSICMAHWSQFKYQTLAMPVNGIYDPWEVTLGDWREEAARCSLDPDVVEGIVRDVASSLVSLDYHALPCKDDIAQEIEGYVHECMRDLLVDL